MKQGKTLSQLAAELESQQASKFDFVADTRNVELTFPTVEEKVDGGMNLPTLTVENVGDFEVTRHASRQMCSRLKVPAKFYDLMDGGSPRERDALAEVFNARFNDSPETRMLRTFSTVGGAGYTVPVGFQQIGDLGRHSGKARAYLSDRYRRLDNVELLMQALPTLQEAGEMTVTSCEVTERRMFLKVVFPDIVAEPVVGDVVRSGLVISNSEVGHGSLKVEPLIERLICLNGMTTNAALRKFHIGRTQEEGLLAVLSDEAFAADDAALWLKVRDVIRASIDDTAFQHTVKMLAETADRKVTDVVAAVEVLGQHFRFGDEEQRGVLSALVAGDAMIDAHGLRDTQYGLIQAVTAYSQQIDDYERATDFESIGGQILDLKPTEWKRIATATA